MSVTGLKEMRNGLADRIGWLRTRVARASAVPLLVRAGAWLAGVAALALALPAELLLSGPGLVLLVVTALPALAPRRSLVTVVVLVPVGGWLVSTGWYGGQPALWRLVGLAGLLYVGHSCAALAAALPYDAIVSPGVLRRWFLRLGLVLAVTSVLGGYAMLAGELLRGRATVLATLVGLAVAVGVAAVLARRAPRPEPSERGGTGDADPLDRAAGTGPHRPG